MTQPAKTTPEIPDGMMEKQVKSVLPFYCLGAVWLILGFVLPPYKLSNLFIIAAISVAAFAVAAKLLPPKTILVPIPFAAFCTGEGALDAALNQARSDLAALKKVNARIADAALSAEIARMEKAGAAILQEVAAHPEKAKKIRRFCTYYLPTSIKVLNAYADSSASGSTGENAAALRREVAANAQAIAAAFEQQLDSLFSADVLDVSTDLETMKTVQAMDNPGNVNTAAPDLQAAAAATATQDGPQLNLPCDME